MATRLTVLFVDADQSFLDKYGILLEEAGYRVMATPTALQAISMIRRYKINLVILDLTHQPGAGASSIVELQNGYKTSHPPILIFSVLSESNELQKALKLGASDYLVKGRVTPSEVLRKIRQMTVSSRRTV